MISKIRILIADNQPVVRYGLRAVLESDPALEIVGEASDGLEALEQIDSHRPNLLITDVVLPSVSGLEVVRQIRQRPSQTNCLFFSLHNADHYIHEAFRCGAQGYLLKQAPHKQILEAIRCAGSGQRYISPDLSERIVNAYLERVHQFVVSDAYDDLTARERETLQLVAEGATNVEIADRLFISARTVEIYRANVMRKLSLKTQSELIRYSIKRGIISLT